MEVEPLCIQKSILEYFEPKPPEPAGISPGDQGQLRSQEKDEYFASCNDRNQGDKIEGNTKEHTSSNEEQREVMKNTVHKVQDTGNTIHTTTPSVSCVLTKKGYCSFHEKQAEKISVTTKKWKDRGGGKGFGWVTIRTKKYQCRVKKTGPTNSTFAEGLSSQMLRSISSDVVGDYGTDIQPGVEKESLVSAD